MWYDAYEFEDDLDDMEQYEREQLREDARIEREEAEDGAEDEAEDGAEIEI